MKTRLVACMASGMMLATAMPLPSVQAADPAKITLPDWIPNDYASAIDFCNTYGASHIEDGLICMVFKEIPSDYTVTETGETAKRLKQDLYTKTGSMYNFEVIVYQPVKAGDLEIFFADTRYLINDPEADPLTMPMMPPKTYTFSIDDSLQAAETDMYRWMPDSAEEYRLLTISHDVVVYDNYVVIPTTATNGVPSSDWELSDGGSGCFAYPVTSDCSFVTEEPVDGGEQRTVYAFQAIKDGYDKIEMTYNLIDETGKKSARSRVANCVVYNDAQTVLLPGQMHATIADYDTGEPIPLPAGAMPMMWTNIEFHEAEGPVSTGPIYGFETNPVVFEDIAGFFDADVFSFGLMEKDIPEGYVLPERPVDLDTAVQRFNNGSADVVFRLKKKAPAELGANETRITLYDKDTGELIPSELLVNHTWGFGTDIRFKKPDVPGGWIMTGPLYYLETNPAVYKTDLASLYRSADVFQFLCDDQPEVKCYDNGSMDLIFRTKITASGNINGDGVFSKQDAETLQKLLHGDEDVSVYNWGAADYDLDDKLTAADLTLMKRALIRNHKEIVKPTNEMEYAGAMFALCGDDTNLYAGPSSDYPVIETFELYDWFYEKGYNDGDDDWIYAEKDDIHGWFRVHTKAGDEMNIDFKSFDVDKPVIYLYPEQETDVHVELELTTSELATTYPKYQDGWDVTAYPDGSLLNKADGTHHRYLFWDSTNARTAFDFSKGFCIAGKDTESFLKEALTQMGLNENEMNEFIVYWLPRMERNPYNLIAFQGEAYTDSAKLHITPAPDSICRVFMAYMPMENAVEIEPQTFETFERKGFSVVEWGGSEINLHP